MIKFRSVAFFLGLVLSKLAIFMWFPTLLAFFTGTEGFLEFLKAVLITHAAALLFISYGRKEEFQLGVREMFLLTSLVWVVLCGFGALPFVFINHISFTDAYFEVMSGISTTGSTVLSGLDTMAPSILLWRSLVQWLGGIGFIVMAVAVLPYLGVGGMKLFHTESSDWSDKGSPRAKTVANHIMLVYVALSISCAAAYWLTGMSFFEAINHGMTTLATGGYSTSDKSMGKFSYATHWVSTLFMLLASLPSLLYVQSLRKKEFSLFKDEQVRGFLAIFLAVTLCSTLYLGYKDIFSWWDALRISAFNVANVMSTCGFGLEDFSAWGSFTSLLFGFLFLTGACSGSTSGGMKIFRLQITGTIFIKQIRHLIHPAGIFPQKYNGKNLHDGIIRSVVTFIFAYFGIIITIALLLGLIGLTPEIALTAALTAVTNVGPGFGPEIGPTGNFANIPDLAKWLMCFGMLLGRLEILTVAVLFFPSFWKE